MENNQERVFAYNLSKVIDNDDLVNISGGSAQMSHHQTVHGSGGSGQGVDVVYDTSFDW